MKWDRRAPFLNGQLQGYPPPHWRKDEVEWRDADEVRVLHLVVESYGRGRSAAFFTLTDQDGHEWPMFLTDFLDFVQWSSLRNGVAGGVTKCVIAKRGQNYGLKMVKP